MDIALYQDREQLVQSFLSRVRRQVEREADDSWSEENVLARASFLGLCELETNRSDIRSLEFWIAVQIERDRLYLHYRPTDEHPEGFGSLRELLQAVGFSGSTLSDIATVAERVAPYAEEQGIDLGKYILSDNRPKLEAAISSLRSAAEGGDRRQFESILADVEDQPSRDAMRRLYVQPRKERIARGTTFRARGKVIIPLVIEDENDVQAILARLNGYVAWGEVLGILSEFQNSVRLTLEE